MLRRDVLRAFGSAGLVAAFANLSPERLHAVGLELHRHSAGSLRALTAAQSELVSALADLILPRTDTPGALDVGTVEFIDLLVAEWFIEVERVRLVAGLEAVDRASVTAYGRNFAALSPDERVAIATALDAFEYRAPQSASDAWYTVKRFTVFSYATSKPVMQDIIKYKIWPGRFDGCAVDEATLPVAPS